MPKKKACVPETIPGKATLKTDSNGRPVYTDVFILPLLSKGEKKVKVQLDPSSTIVGTNLYEGVSIYEDVIISHDKSFRGRYAWVPVEFVYDIDKDGKRTKPIDIQKIKNWVLTVEKQRFEGTTQDVDGDTAVDDDVDQTVDEGEYDFSEERAGYERHTDESKVDESKVDKNEVNKNEVDDKKGSPTYYRRWQMSRKTVEEGDDCLELTDGVVDIEFDSLRIENRCNWVYPFTFIGNGGASVALTWAQMAYVMGEYLRYSSSEMIYTEDDKPQTVEIDTVAFRFLVDTTLRKNRKK